MLSRRNFLKTATISIVADSFLINNVLADDFRKTEGDVYRPQYEYNPFDNNQNSTTTIKNNILPLAENEQVSFWNQPRKLFLKRLETNEQANIYYFADGKVNMQGYKVASYILRDVKQNKMIGIDLKLLDLVCAVQAWLRYYGVTSPIIVHSGYRTAKTNDGLEGAAKKSMHLQGRAIDFSVPGLSPIILAKIAAQFKAGGIGIYQSSKFIHLDTGGIRVWHHK